MRMEVHVHGTIHLRAGIVLTEINDALQPWLEYLEAKTIHEVKSMHHDELGIHFDSRSNVLEICWSADVSENFENRVEPAIRALCPLSEIAAEIEVSYFDDDGNDDMSIVFVGPTPASIHEAQRRRMAEDVSDLLVRHFDEPAINEVVSLVNDLFSRDWARRHSSIMDFSTGDTLPLDRRRHLH
ncbi:MAG: DUF6806 family protein [Pseudomonadota bacterium]